MAAVGRDGSPAQKSVLTMGEMLMFVGLIACGLVDFLVTLVALGMI